MKRTERQHLKGNELVNLALSAQRALEARRRQVIPTLIVVVVVSAGVLGYSFWRSRVQARAGALLADAVAVETARVGPPAGPDASSEGPSFATHREKHEAAAQKFKAVADQYPSTDAGIFARYREAATLLTLGRAAEAEFAYEQVLHLDGNGIYGQMARLGAAEARARAGQVDRAIDTYKELAQQSDGSLPIDGILMQLGRLYVEAGKTAEAQQTFNRVVDEFPDSPFSSEARREMESLKKKT